jgi:hypothetical protein
MGKKRRVLRSSKFANLRRHPKYASLVAANEQKAEEIQEVVIEEKQATSILDIITPEIKVPEPVTEVVEETPPPKLSKSKVKAPRKKRTSTKKRRTKKKTE